MKKIEYKLFKKKKNKKKFLNEYKNLISKNNNASEIINSWKTNYKYSYSGKSLNVFKNNNNIRIFGMGGSSLGSKAIHDFLTHKVKKKINFIDNIVPGKVLNKKKKHLNLIISKSGNTLETIVNSNLYINNKDANIIITEKSKSLITQIANQLKCDIVEHNNFIGGRYSVLSETGMLPTYLMGLNPNKFKVYNNLIKNKKFINNLISSTSSIFYFMQNKYTNSIILNYDEKSDSLFKWYQQLVGESLGKKGKGILPMISTMPKDNHSLLQYYLDGPKKSFYTIFSVNEKSIKRKNKFKLSKPFNKFTETNPNKILYSQKHAIENIFDKKNIPYRSINVLERSEVVMGELFCFFMLETILLGRALKINPLNQPSVEIVKKRVSQILLKT
tara:strand:+ start:673 stop:1836 length:1164 start_codon:yes stop_codon:yes gene_type:complete